MVQAQAKKRILVTGARGFLGRAVMRQLAEVSPYDVMATQSSEHDLTKLPVCVALTKDVDIIIHLAGLVLSRAEQKKRPADVLFTNTITTLNIAEAARQNKVSKIIFTSSVTAYPEQIASPFREEDLWAGPVADGSHAYGVSKRFTESIARAYRDEGSMQTVTLILPNLYGPGDKFHYSPPPLIPNIISQIHTAKTAGVSSIVGGNNGEALLDVLYVEEAARAVVLATTRDDLPPVINISTGEATSIKTMFETAAQVLEYTGRITWEVGAPGIARLMSNERARDCLRWENQTSFEAGIKATVADYLQTIAKPM